MISRLTCLMVAGGLLILFTGCGGISRPVLYPNEKLQAVGNETAQRDIEDCLRLSSQAGQTNSAAKVAGSTAVGAGTGAAVGAATGAFWESAGSGAAGGAAGGAIAGFLHGLFRTRDLDPVQARFVEECLNSKGYRVIGWR